MYPISSSSTSSNVETRWRTYFDAKRLIRQTEQRLNETRTIYPHVHLSNHQESAEHAHLSTSLSSNSFFHRSIYPEERVANNGKVQLRDSEALQTIRRKINKQKLAAERRAEQLFHSQSDAGHLFDTYRPSPTNYSTSASLQNLHYSPHRQISSRLPTSIPVNHLSSSSSLSQSQSFPSELDTVLRHSRGTHRDNDVERTINTRTMTTVVPKESLSYTNGRSSQQRSASASTGLANKYQDLPPSRLLTPTEGKHVRRGEIGKSNLLSNDSWRTDVLVSRKEKSMTKRTKGDDDEPFNQRMEQMIKGNKRETNASRISTEKTPLKPKIEEEEKKKVQELIQQKRQQDEFISHDKRLKDEQERSRKEKLKRLNEPINDFHSTNKRPSAFTPVTPKEFTEQTRHRLLRLLGSSTDQPAVLERSLSSSSSSSSSFSSSSSSSTNSIIEVQGEKNSFSNGRSRSEPPISNGPPVQLNGQRHDNLVRWAATLTRDCDIVENRLKYFRSDGSQISDHQHLQYDDGNLRYSTTSMIRPSSSSHDGQNERRIYHDRAAAKIQAAYRGYTVRKSLLSLNEKEKQLHSEFNQRPPPSYSKVYPDRPITFDTSTKHVIHSDDYDNVSHHSSILSTPTNNKKIIAQDKSDYGTSSSVTPVPSPSPSTKRRSISPPRPTAMSPDNGRPLPHIPSNDHSLIDNNERKSSPVFQSIVKKRKSRSPALQPPRHRTSQNVSPPTSSSESILTAREKRIRQKFNSEMELQAYEKRLKDIEKKIRQLVKRAIEIFDEKRNISSPPGNVRLKPTTHDQSSISEDTSISHEKVKKESDLSIQTRASSETVTSDVSDLERRVHDYSEQLKGKKKELERLKRRNKEILRRQENELIRQIESYDQQIQSLRLQPQEQTVPIPSPKSSTSANSSLQEQLSNHRDIDVLPKTNGHLHISQNIPSLSISPDVPIEEKPIKDQPEVTQSSSSSTSNEKPIEDVETSSSSSIPRSEPSPSISPELRRTPSPPIEDHPIPSEIIRPPSPHVADYDEDFSEPSPSIKLVDVEPETISEHLDHSTRPQPTNTSVSSRSSDEEQSVILVIGEKSITNTPTKPSKKSFIEEEEHEEFPPPPPINDDTSKDISDVEDETLSEKKSELISANLPLTLIDSVNDIEQSKHDASSTSGEEMSDEDNQKQSTSQKDDFEKDINTLNNQLIVETQIDPTNNGTNETEEIHIDLSPLDVDEPRVESPRKVPVEESIKPVVSHTRDQVLQLSHDALTILFNQNETFADRTRINRTIPESFFQRLEQESDTGDIPRSRRAYGRMIFDLCVELLYEIYSPNIHQSKYPEWQKSKLISKRFYRLANPQSRDETEQLIQKKILEILNLTPKEIVYSKWRLPMGRRQDETRFEMVLDEELRRTETNWINYDDDSIRIKFDLAERIFEQIMEETLNECIHVLNRRWN